MASASSSSLNTAPYTPVADKSVRFSPASNSFDSSTNSTVFTSHGSNRHIVGMGGTLKTEIEEKQKLEKENFDLKLKIYHLEESLRQLSSGEVNSEVLDLQSEVTHLRHQLQEHRIDLEHRNTLLIKAKGVIETLKGEMMVMKEQLDKKSTQEVHLHHQLQNVTHERDSYDESLQHRIDLLEEENSSLKQTNLENSQTLHQCRIQIVSLLAPDYYSELSCHLICCVE